MDRATPNYSPAYFMLHPDIQAAESTFQRNMQGAPLTNKSVIDTLPDFVKKSINSMNNDALFSQIDSHYEALKDQFGQGAPLYLKQNLDQFEPDQKLKLYYLMDQWPKDKPEVPPPSIGDSLGNGLRDALEPITKPLGDAMYDDALAGVRKRNNTAP